MAKRKSLKFSIIPKFLILLLLSVAIAGFAVFIKNVYAGTVTNDRFVKIGNNTIYTIGTGYRVGLKEDNPLKVNVSSGSDENVKYATRIDADSSLRFSYVKDDKLCFFTSSEDVSSFFEIEETDTGFCVSAKGVRIIDMLSCLYPDSKISFDDSYIDYKSTLFWITVSFDGDVNSFVKIGFSLKRYAQSITLDAKEIIF